MAGGVRISIDVVAHEVCYPFLRASTRDGGGRSPAVRDLVAVGVPARHWGTNARGSVAEARKGKMIKASTEIARFASSAEGTGDVRPNDSLACGDNFTKAAVGDGWGGGRRGGRRSEGRGRGRGQRGRGWMGGPEVMGGGGGVGGVG